MITAFDHIAVDYDRTFTDTATGLLQRKIVHNYLTKHFSQEGLGIFEINCGTGADAAFLSEMGHQVTACDASTAMIEVAKNKFGDKNIEFIHAGFSEIDNFPDHHYDLIFSNFGGLNCIDREGLGILLGDLYNKLKPGGRMVLVVMGKFCLWESLYFLAKGNWKNILRRKKKTGSVANIGGQEIDVFYYSPEDFLYKNLKIKNIKPVGAALPPSYLESFFKKHSKWLSFLKKIDGIFSEMRVMARLSDHFLIDLQKPVNS